MDDRCRLNKVKFFLGVSDLVLMASGVLTLTTGILVWSDFSDYRHFLEERILVCPIILIVGGCISIILFIVGFCHGTVRRNSSTQYEFSIVIVLITIMEAAVVFLTVWFMMSSDNFRVSLREILVKAMKSHNPQDQLAWHQVQKSLECCGAQNPTDWYKYQIFVEPRLHLSCCKSEVLQPGQNCDIRHSWKLHEVGCLRVLEEHIATCGMILLAVGASGAMSKISGIISVAIHRKKRASKKKEAC